MASATIFNPCAKASSSCSIWFFFKFWPNVDLTVDLMVILTRSPGKLKSQNSHHVHSFRPLMMNLLYSEHIHSLHSGKNKCQGVCLKILLYVIMAYSFLDSFSPFVLLFNSSTLLSLKMSLQNVLSAFWIKTETCTVCPMFLMFDVLLYLYWWQLTYLSPCSRSDEMINPNDE